MAFASPQLRDFTNCSYCESERISASARRCAVAHSDASLRAFSMSACAAVLNCSRQPEGLILLAAFSSAAALCCSNRCGATSCIGMTVRGFFTTRPNSTTSSVGEMEPGIVPPNIPFTSSGVR
jgi:hypothetical protein